MSNPQSPSENPSANRPKSSGVPDVVGKIHGWRAWHVDIRAAMDGDFRLPWLYPLAMRTYPEVLRIWDSETAMAWCDLTELERMFKGGPPPHRNCRCGIYAMYERGEAEVEIRGKVLGHVVYPQCIAFGSIRAWGRVCRHDFGFRTQYAEIERIEWIGTRPMKYWENQGFLYREFPRVISALAAKYPKADILRAEPICFGGIQAEIELRELERQRIELLNLMVMPPMVIDGGKRIQSPIIRRYPNIDISKWI